MPNSATLSSAVETAAKWSPTASSPRAAVNQSRAVLALVMVSIVVNVFDATMTSVVFGFSAESVSLMCAPSTFDT